MLVRDQPATELTIATRILARAGALSPDGRVTLRLHDVLYIGGRDTVPSTMTPYDVAVVLMADGATLHGTPPDAVGAYLDAHRRVPSAASIALANDGTVVTAPTLRGCVVAALHHAQGDEGRADDATIERVWLELVSQARLTGALVGAFPTEDDAG